MSCVAPKAGGETKGDDGKTGSGTKSEGVSLVDGAAERCAAERSAEERGHPWLPFDNKRPDDDRDEGPGSRAVAALCLCLGVLGFLGGVVCYVVASTPPTFSLERLSVGLMVFFGFAVTVCLCLQSCCCCSGKGEGDTSDGRRTFKGKYQFKRLNATHAHSPDDLSKLLEDSGRQLPKEAFKVFKERQKKKDAEEKARVKELEKKRETELAAKIDALFDEGMTSESVMCHLRPVAFVIEFNGDMQASEVSELRRQVDLLQVVAKPSDEIVLKLMSPGGVVSSYGLAAVQLMRLREAGLNLTVCVDTIAASGGYMMAVVANKIVASPFAFIGSIGVVCYVPNLKKLLEKNDVDMHLFTAGKYKRTVDVLICKYKRTVDVLGTVTEEGKSKLQEELTRLHGEFKTHVKKHRPQLDTDVVCTGEAWSGGESLGLGLVDELSSSDEYLARKMKTHDVVQVKRKAKKKEGLVKEMLLGPDDGEEDDASGSGGAGAAAAAQGLLGRARAATAACLLPLLSGTGGGATSGGSCLSATSLAMNVEQALSGALSGSASALAHMVSTARRRVGLHFAWSSRPHAQHAHVV